PTFDLHVLLLFPPILSPPPTPTLFPYTTLFRSPSQATPPAVGGPRERSFGPVFSRWPARRRDQVSRVGAWLSDGRQIVGHQGRPDRKSTRLNSSHVSISYAVFCLKKKRKIIEIV